ncbi:MAG TPA: c-type cytochrome [Flavisolibacter sp.]|jgi:hypothetical protein
MKKSFLVIFILVCVVSFLSAFTKITTNPGYKNLKILPQDITEKQMDSVMDHFTQSLNVKCGFCHVKQQTAGNEEWDWASDKNKHKLVARDMMKMTNKLNDEYFPYSGKAENLSTILTVTCYTCHNGNKEPVTRPKKKD